jgi:hypothetical protein
MNNLPWQPCPRCRSKTVKVAVVASAFSNVVMYTVLIGGFIGVFVYLADLLNASLFFTVVIFGFVGVVALPVIGILAAIIGSLFSNSKRVYKCDTCGLSWDVKGTATTTAPSRQPR